jgi:hypothetical protein
MTPEIKSNTIEKEFGTESDVECITGRKRRTLQKDRCLGRGFPFYRFNGQVLYDLAEVRQIIRGGRVSSAYDGGRPV